MSNGYPFSAYATSLKRHKWLVIAMALACAIGAAATSHSTSKVFRGECVLSLKNLRDEQITAKDLVDMVGTLSREKMAAIFSHPMSVQSVALSELKGSVNKIRVAITARQRDDIAPALDEFVAYLNDTALFKTVRDQQRAQITIQIAELTRTIEKAEQTQALIDRMLEQGKLTPVGFNPVDLTKHISDYRVEKRALEQALNFLVNVQVAQRLFVAMEPVGPSWRSVALAGAVLGFLIGAFLVCLVDAARKRSAK